MSAARAVSGKWEARFDATGVRGRERKRTNAESTPTELTRGKERDKERRAKEKKQVIARTRQSARMKKSNGNGVWSER